MADIQSAIDHIKSSAGMGEKRKMEILRQLRRGNGGIEKWK